MLYTQDTIKALPQKVVLSWWIIARSINHDKVVEILNSIGVVSMIAYARILIAGPFVLLDHAFQHSARCCLYSHTWSFLRIHVWPRAGHDVAAVGTTSRCASITLPINLLNWSTVYALAASHVYFAYEFHVNLFFIFSIKYLKHSFYSTPLKIFLTEPSSPLQAFVQMANLFIGPIAFPSCSIKKSNSLDLCNPKATWNIQLWPSIALA